MNIGYRMGRGYCVLDIDPRNGGAESLKRLEAEYGPLPRTPKVITGGGGEHYYFLEPTGMKKGTLAPGIDFQGEGSQVLAPPSIHKSGQCYKWELAPTGIEAGVEQVPFAMLPEWVKGLQSGLQPLPLRIQAAQRPEPSAFAFILPSASISEAEGQSEGQSEGQRHATLLKLVGRELSRGVDAEEVLATALEWNDRNDPPLPEHEVERQVVALAKKEGKKAVQHPPSPPPTEAGKEGKEGKEAPEAEGGATLLSSFPSFHRPGEADEEGGERVVVQPTLPPEAFHGPLGSMAVAVGQYSEADEWAILLSLLTCFGNAVGHGPYFDHGVKHGGNLFTALVGPTASRKGTALRIGKALIGELDAEWRDHRFVHEGFGSGEGVIWAVRDARDGGDGKPDPGVNDKRLLVAEEEWAKAFTLGNSEKSILTSIIRSAFDRSPIGKRNKGDNAYVCLRPHISILANITPDDLRLALSGKNSVSIANGFVNRFLLVNTERTKYLPFGGKWGEAAKPYMGPLASALAQAKGWGHMALSREAEGVWREEYARLERRPEGVVGEATARASDQSMKLALVFALADGAGEIGLAHLRAGLAVWAYCEATAMSLFSAGTNTPISLPEKLLQAIGIKPGILRSELWEVAGHKAKAEELEGALNGLEASGRAYREMVPTAGRKAEAWFPGERPKAVVVQHTLSSPSLERPEAGKEGKEERRGEGEPEAGASFPSFPSFPLPPEPSAGASFPSFPLSPFAEELAASRPAPLTGGKGDVVPPPPDADALIREVYASGGKIMRTPTGGLTVKVWDWPLPWPEGQPLPTVPNAEQVEAVANRKAVADGLLTEEEFDAEIREM